MKKVLLDTSTMVSAIAFGGFPGKSLKIAIENPNIKAYVSRTILEELEEVFNKNKLVDSLPIYLSFMDNFPEKIIILEDSKEKVLDEDLLTGENDRKIYRTAVAHGLDILISGDKHFLNSGITGTQVLKARDFVELIQKDKEE